jgi:hypothetical protein
VRLLGMPYPLVGVLQLGYLLDLIYTRDTWMHRLTSPGRPAARCCSPRSTTAASSRARHARPGADARASLADSPSRTSWPARPAGLAHRRVPAAAATIRLDTLDFNLLASGRCTMEQASAVIEGDRALADPALRETKVMY